MSKHLVINGTEEWQLRDDANLVQLQADLRSAMDDGRVIDTPVVLDQDRGAVTLFINGAQVATALVSELEQPTGSFAGLTTAKTRIDGPLMR